MNIQLIQGHFDKKDAIDLLTQLVYVKVKFQEDKIRHLENEEDIKMRENRIKQLQNKLQEVRKYLDANNTAVSLNSIIEIQ